jgi:hypothetical protein
MIAAIRSSRQEVRRARALHLVRARFGPRGSFDCVECAL